MQLRATFSDARKWRASKFVTDSDDYFYLQRQPRRRLCASKILDINPHAALYVPFRVALFDDDGTEGAHLSSNRPGSSRALLRDPTIDEIGGQLDAKIDAVVEAVCGPASAG